MQTASHIPVFPKSEIRDYFYFRACGFLVTNWKIGFPKADFDWVAAVLLETFAIAGDMRNIPNVIVQSQWTAESRKTEVNYVNT